MRKESRTGVRATVPVLKPEIGERIYDGVVGSAGASTEAIARKASAQSGSNALMLA
jgi:hypothetical protein